MLPHSGEDVVEGRFLVIGTGIAGLQFALLAAANDTVRLVTKRDKRESNTNYAQGGIAAVVSPLDDFESHINDTLIAGDGLCDEAAVRRLVEAGPRLIEQLVSYGVPFNRESDAPGARFALGREGGHSRRRVLHCNDVTGREVETQLLAACASHPNITIHEDHMGLDLLKAKDLSAAACLDATSPDRIVGCLVLDCNTLTRQVFVADAVILATGGCGKVYNYTSNPDVATGDGMAMAYRAGAEVRNLEFVQFHPTCLYHPEAKSFLISEAVRGEGAVLINHEQEKFMARYHPMADLAPRDVVARSIDQEMKLSGKPCAFLDLRHLDREKIEARFPNLVEKCAEFGIDMVGEPVPVVPAAHYMCGGVTVDEFARTSLSGLYAIGEVASTGVHGANRLASNSLLEAAHFANQAIIKCADEPVQFEGTKRSKLSWIPWSGGSNEAPARSRTMVLEHDWDQVRRVMWDYVGIVRDRERLGIALERVRTIRATVEGLYLNTIINPAVVELRNISLLAELIVLCASSRRESRGLHYSSDYPDRSFEAVDTVITRGQLLAGESSWEPDDVPGPDEGLAHG
ncbi:MAG: L-aspartate oxidase [Candidatus Krumholzibacteriia bacterium]|jgi:L-aspartate oxidase